MDREAEQYEGEWQRCSKMHRNGERNEDKKSDCWDFGGGPKAKTCAPNAGVPVQSLVRELDSHMLQLRVHMQGN